MPCLKFIVYSFPSSEIEKDFASFGMGCPVIGCVVKSPSYMTSESIEDMLSFVLKGLNVFGPSPIVEDVSVPPNCPIGAWD